MEIPEDDSEVVIEPGVLKNLISLSRDTNKLQATESSWFN